MHYRFPSIERLKSKKAIATLFRTGKRWYGKRLTLYYTEAEVQSGVQHRVLFAVPKSRLKRAVDRNKVKRRLREAYRQGRHFLHHLTPLSLGFVYVSKEGGLPSYALLTAEVTQALRFLRHTYEGKIKSL